MENYKKSSIKKIFNTEYIDEELLNITDNPKFKKEAI